MKSFFTICSLASFFTVSAPAQNNMLVVQTDSGRNEVFELTEGMKASEEDLMRNYNNRTNLTPPATSNVRDLPYDDKVIADRLSRIPTIIDLPLNDITRKYIDTYTNRMKKSVGVMLGAANFYNPIFEEALERYNLPLELKYLPVIESGLRPDVTSVAGAAGLWQFILMAGKQYGLEVNTLVDERRDPIKSSEAAARFLSDLYQTFGDWSLAIAAYNCGPGSVQKAILRAGGEKGSIDFWDIYNYLPTETRGYVPAFVAATYIMNYYCEHGITPMSATLPAESDTVVVTHDARFSNISSLCNVSMEELRALNPQYRRDIVPRNYALRLPQHAIEPFITKESQIYGKVTPTSVSNPTEDNATEDNQNVDAAAADNATEVAVAEVKPLDVNTTKKEMVTASPKAASVTASRYATRTADAANAYNSRYARRQQAKLERAKRRQQRYQTKSVEVVNGDNLSKIARKNGTTVEQLRKLNGLKGDVIRTGQKIRVK